MFVACLKLLGIVELGGQKRDALMADENAKLKDIVPREVNTFGLNDKSAIAWPMRDGQQRRVKVALGELN